MKVAIYSRVSTDRQSHDSQLLELRAYCSRKGWSDVVEYSDQVSGAKFTRQGLDALMKVVRRGNLDVVVCFKLDRLGRSLVHLAQLVAEFAPHRVALICTSQGIDTSEENPAGRLQLGVLMAVAEFEREIIRERVKAGLAAARNRGVRLGRPPVRPELAGTVVQLRSEGLSYREIALQLGISTARSHVLATAPGHPAAPGS